MIGYLNKSHHGQISGQKSPFRHHKFDGDCVKDKKVGVKF